eukprot:6461579-Amphidinium_carterae.1
MYQKSEQKPLSAIPRPFYMIFPNRMFQKMSEMTLLPLFIREQLNSFVAQFKEGSLRVLMKLDGSSLPLQK